VRVHDPPRHARERPAQGIERVGGTAEQFNALLRAELAQWAKVIREAGIRVE